MASRPKEAEGQPIIGNKIKVLGASGLRYDGEPLPGKGAWIEVTIRGQSDGVEIDFQKGGVVREVIVKASPDHCHTALMDEAPPELEGQTKLDEAEADEKGDVPDNVASLPAGEPDAGSEPGED